MQSILVYERGCSAARKHLSSRQQASLNPEGCIAASSAWLLQRWSGSAAAAEVFWRSGLWVALVFTMSERLPVYHGLMC